MPNRRKKKWYCLIDRTIYGPYSVRQLRWAARRKKIQRATRVSESPEGPWFAVEELLVRRKSKRPDDDYQPRALIDAGDVEATGADDPITESNGFAAVPFSGNLPGLSYVSQSLSPDEHVIRAVELPSALWVYLWLRLAIAAMVVIVLWAINPLYGLGALTIVLLVAVLEVIHLLSREIAITNQRVIYKSGWISRISNEQRLAKIESISMEQSMLGRLFDYATVVVTGTGGHKLRLPGCDDPFSVKTTIEALLQ